MSNNTINPTNHTTISDDLLEALEELIAVLETQPETDEGTEALAKAYDAIAKARGEVAQAKSERISTERIAELNDLCRRAMGVAGRLVQTEGINALSPDDQSVIREQVENFSDFPEDNDPYGERDFGAFDHNGQRIFWKIDYYDRTLTYGSENPADPEQTVRVLTIMLANEY